MRNSKVLTWLVVALCLTLTTAFESYYKFRLNKDFIHNLFKHNARLLFERAESFQVRDTELSDIKAQMSNIRLKIQPHHKEWNKLKMEMIVDEG